ncbi:NHRF1 protein, partial [Ptilorrhoa leucosticta]|nr:NHRF1 protein [Ptilorrhoa leucosticta]
MSSGAGPAARLCRLERGPDGYGFHLHGEKGKPGQFIRLVEAGSPAERSGLRAGDRLLEVDGENVERESHQQVVERIRAAAGAVSLLVVDSTAEDQLPKRAGVDAEAPVVGGHAAPVPAEPAAREPSGGDQRELRPRLCHMKKGPDGYGFNLHSDKSRPGQYVRAVDPGSPAEAAGLAPQDRIIEVNGVCMEGKQHGDVVAAIKASGDETRLLVVDVLTDEFFKKCKVVPSEQHLTGPLPEPVANGDTGKENGGEPRSNSVSESPSSPAPLAVSPNSSETHSEVGLGMPGGGSGWKAESGLSPHRGAVQGTRSGADTSSHPQPHTQEGDKHHSASGSLLDLDIPLAVAKERAHQKRTSKRAPQMDWSKKNELFSNL